MAPTSSPPPEVAAADPLASTEGAAAGPAAVRAWGQWFSGETEPGARRALVPPALGERILSIYLVAAGASVLSAAIPVYVQNPGDIRHWAEFWVFFGMGVVQLATASVRRLPFVGRYALLATTLFILIAIGSVTAGITPTWVILVSMLLTSTALLYGIAAGMIGVAVILLAETAAAWAWTHGLLPLVGGPSDLAAFYDYRDGTVWVRVILSSGVFLVALLFLMRFVMSSLREALMHSNHALRHLAAEQVQRAQVTDALRASEAKFSKVFQASPISIIVSELETGRIIDANDAFLQTYRCTREQAIGHSTTELGLWRDVSERDWLIALLRRGEQVRDFRIKGRTYAGAAITVLVNCELVRLDERTVLLTLVQDITEQERAELALRESEEKFSRAFRSGPNAMAISEFGTGRYVDINEGFERLFGYRREEVIGRTSIELGIFRSAADRETVISQIRENGAVRDLELATRNRHGVVVTYIVNAESMSLGNERYLVMSAQDITARKRAETEHARALEREMQMRQEFTRRLLDVQEEERRRIAGELHDSLGQNLLLLKNRAHLARTDDRVAPDIGGQFETIEEMASLAIAEVRQISHDLHPYQLDQLGLTRALEGMLSGVAQSTGFPFKSKFDLVDEVFDRESSTHVFRIVQECVNNILRHARAHSATVLLERDIRQVRFWIEDDGNGFDPERRGFGLKNIAERVRILGGKLTIDSAPGKGTRLEVMLPVRADL